MINDQCSISPTYLRTAFTLVAPKSVRIKSSCQYLFTLLVSTGTKAACRMLMKLTPGLDFENMFVSSFYKRRFQKHKKTVNSSVSFCSFGICLCKSCSKNVDEIDPRFFTSIYCKTNYFSCYLTNSYYFF
jgi:hypothetical protein